jgi:hypothetical protein
MLQVVDFPFCLRALLVATILLFGINLLILSVSIVAIVSMLDSLVTVIAAWLKTRPTTSSILLLLLAGLLGAALSYLVTRLSDWARREKETKDVIESLFNEIADRGARCLNDYLKPWRNFKNEEFKGARVAKFRPAQPVVYPSVAGKLGLIDPTTVFWVLRFYQTLDAINREIDDARTDFPNDKVPSDRTRLIAQRFEQSLEPALEALERLRLNVRNYNKIDEQAAYAYQWVREAGGPLRKALATAMESPICEKTQGARPQQQI